MLAYRRLNEMRRISRSNGGVVMYPESSAKWRNGVSIGILHHRRHQKYGVISIWRMKRNVKNDILVWRSINEGE